MSACCCSLAGTAACQTCSQNPFAVMSKMMAPQPTVLRDIMVNLQTKKPQTNADCIRSMSDEELADFLDRWEMGDVDYSKTFCCLCDEQYDCHDDCLMDWLKAPVEVDNG